MMKCYDVLVLITPKDFPRLKRLYYKLGDFLPAKKIIFVGSKEVGEQVKKFKEEYPVNRELYSWMDEDSILPFSKVHEIICDIFPGADVQRGFTGWYYQQFLKMQYAYLCKDEYYMVWDGDTIPVRPIAMTDVDGRPYFDMKKEYYPPYFVTLKKIFPDLEKCMQQSFISEHMLIKSDIMRKLCEDVMKNANGKSETFYEFILRAIGNPGLNEAAFSEFETYGTYTEKQEPSLYTKRKWCSFRNAGQYFDPQTIREQEMTWLGKDFDAISFEKGHQVEEGAEFFQNPVYQQKLSAAEILKIVQEEMQEGYREDL